MADEYYLYIQICISPFKRDQTHHPIRGSKKELLDLLEQLGQRYFLLNLKLDGYIYQEPLYNGESLSENEANAEETRAEK